MYLLFQIIIINKEDDENHNNVFISTTDCKSKYFTWGEGRGGGEVKNLGPDLYLSTLHNCSMTKEY
jgi:hypothetical protein